MIVQAGFKSVRCMLLAIFVLTPAAVIAQQEKAPQDKVRPEVVQEKTKVVPEHAEIVPTKEVVLRTKPEVASENADAALPVKGATPGQTEAAPPPDANDAKVISGMSILGNQEAPKSLVIVPWKTSELGNTLGITPLLDDSRQPVDKEVFMRALRYYEVRSKTKP